MVDFATGFSTGRSRQKKLPHKDFDGIDSSLGNVLSIRFTFQLNHCTARGASSSVLRLDFSPEKSSGEPGVTRVLQSIDRSVRLGGQGSAMQFGGE